MSQDINYVESIAAALQATVNENTEVDWDSFLNIEKETMISSSCGTHLNVFKGTWKRRFKEVATSLNIQIKSNSGDANTWKTLISNELKAKNISMPTSTSETSASAGTPTSRMSKAHNNPISADEKQSAIRYLDVLADADKWRLKSGRFTEDNILQAIKDSAFEHPCLSYTYC
ncbi:unnamed protein product [Mucor hiemalis]